MKSIQNEDGYELWLRYSSLENSKADSTIIRQFNDSFTSIYFPELSAVFESAQSELKRAFQGLLNKNIPAGSKPAPGCIVCCTADKAASFAETKNAVQDFLNQKSLTDESWIIRIIRNPEGPLTLISGKTDRAVLYGVFAFLRKLQNAKALTDFNEISTPRIKHRILNHWDNLDRTVERGYAGFSLWDWHRLPGYRNPRYYDYARANASIGINGTVLNNVNANALSLTTEYLKKTKVLADIFRAYGLKVYLAVKFSAPIILDGFKTADPLDKKVQQWWKNKVQEIYSYIPDFGGFIVKANSEGQPGPQDYKRSHADGANMLADALAPYKGIVMWRAFVYSPDINKDRIKQAYNEFVPLDGSFAEEVLVQVKNGPLDFQPREPFSPLFGSMPKTPLMIEFQLTQEYLGFSTHLVYLAPMFKECLEADTWADGEGSAVASVVDGSLHGYKQSGIAAVTNIGNDINWCGHPFAAANWYAYGRLAWDHALDEEEIALEWLKMTFTFDSTFITTTKKIMLESRENCVNYMTPLGLHHIMGESHHYGPGPWVDIEDAGRIDWTAVYFHNAGKDGIGFDRTKSGSDAASQYQGPLPDKFSNLETCPENLLLWFHRLPWDYQCKSGLTLWEELCRLYNKGVEAVRQSCREWDSLQDTIDSQRFNQVSQLLAIQEEEAVWWRDACLTYFASFSKMPIPAQYEQPKYSLAEYKAMKFSFVPGI